MSRVTAAFLCLVSSLSAQDGTDAWSRFRGPNGSGVSDGSLPESFARDDAVWAVETSPGYSSPVLDAERIYFTEHEDGVVYTRCLDREDGATLWRKQAPAAVLKPRSVNSPVSPTAVADGDGVHVFFEDYGLVHYDMDGIEVWKHPLGPFKSPYGMAGSPIVVDDMVVMLCDQDVGAFLLALDRASGDVRWRTDRQGRTHSFSTPIVRRDGDATELIVLGAYGVVGYDAAGGDPRWWMEGLAWQSKSTPVLHGDTLYLHSWMAGPSELGFRKVDSPWEDALAEMDADGNGSLSKEEMGDDAAARLWFLYDVDGTGEVDAGDWAWILARGTAENGLYALELGEAGDLSEHVRWRAKRALPNIPSPLYLDGIVYYLKENGVLTALNAETGEVHKQERVPGLEGGGAFASPVAAGGQLLLCGNGGAVSVVQAGADWSVVSEVDLEEDLWATPALSGDRVYLRTESHVRCYE